MDFESSRVEGPHALLAKLIGSYEGQARLWMMPGKLDDDEPATAEIVAINGGQFVRHDYTTRIGGVDQSGTALVGCNLDRSVWRIAWVDTWHTGTDLMSFDGPAADGVAAVDARTTYGTAPEVWGWRISYEPTDTGLLVRHYNIPPEELGAEYLAAEFNYHRRSEPVG